MVTETSAGAQKTVGDLASGDVFKYEVSGPNSESRKLLSDGKAVNLVTGTFETPNPTTTVIEATSVGASNVLAGAPQGAICVLDTPEADLFIVGDEPNVVYEFVSGAKRNKAASQQLQFVEVTVGTDY